MPSLPSTIFQAHLPLAPGIPLHVYLVKGEQGAVFIDSGTRSMFSLLQQCMDEAGVLPHQLSHVLHTHAHHDHIGSNAQLKAFTACQLMGLERYQSWHSDFEHHYEAFARPFPHIFADTPELREEVLGILDAPVPLDGFVEEGMVIDLGGARLEAFAFSGHMKEEMGWFEHHSRTMVFGDVITLMEAPFIHGHVDVPGYRSSLDKIERLLDEQGVERVLFAHFPPQDPPGCRQLIRQARTYIDRVENTVLEVLAAQTERSLEAIWRRTCQRLGKQLEFRSLSTVHAHLAELVQQGRITQTGDGSYELTAPNA